LSPPRSRVRNGRSSRRSVGTRSTRRSNSGIRTSILSSLMPSADQALLEIVRGRQVRAGLGVLVLLLLVGVGDLAVVERDVLHRDVARTAGDAVVGDDDVLHRDVEVLDRLVVLGAVGAEAVQDDLGVLRAPPSRGQPPR